MRSRTQLNKKSSAEELKNFTEVIAKLRDPVAGCPWDLEQTHESLRSYLLEESAEAVEAIDLKDDNNLKEELGDVLLQVVLHAQIASERGAFNLADIISVVSEKMIRRHPHVFGDAKAKNSTEVLEKWEELKKQEKQNNPKKIMQGETPFDSISKTLPALLVSERIGEKSARIAFDWGDLEGVKSKLKEEYQELAVELNKLDKSKLNQPRTSPATADRDSEFDTYIKAGKEIGDCLFTLTQIARWLGMSGELLLSDTNRRFTNRFREMMKELSKNSNTEQNLSNLSEEEIEQAWQKAKITVG